MGPLTGGSRRSVTRATMDKGADSSSSKMANLYWSWKGSRRRKSIMGFCAQENVLASYRDCFYTPAYRQESSTSLSVSDDNSSIQSSPWQRDHSWKQPNPAKGIGQEMALFWWRPRKTGLNRWRGPASRKRRRPLSRGPPEEHPQVKREPPEEYPQVKREPGLTSIVGRKSLLVILISTLRNGSIAKKTVSSGNGKG
nr:unnamed protein product [Callosobruchus analis]